MPGVQLLPMPGDQEQAVVDRDAEAEQRRDGRRSGGERDRRRASRPSSDRPAPTLNRADTSGIAAATSEPNMNSSRISAQDKADDLGGGVVGRLADLAAPAAVLHLQAGLPGRRDGVVQPVEVAGVQRVRVGAPGHARVGDRAVFGHRARSRRRERAHCLEDVGQLGDVGGGLVDGGLRRRRPCRGWRGRRSARSSRPAS